MMSREVETLFKYGVPIKLVKSYQDIYRQRRKGRIAEYQEVDPPVDTLGQEGELLISFRDDGFAKEGWGDLKLKGSDYGDGFFCKSMGVVSRRKPYWDASTLLTTLLCSRNLVVMVLI